MADHDDEGDDDDKSNDNHIDDDDVNDDDSDDVDSLLYQHWDLFRNIDECVTKQPTNHRMDTANYIGTEDLRTHLKMTHSVRVILCSPFRGPFIIEFPAFVKSFLTN